MTLQDVLHLALDLRIYGDKHLLVPIGPLEELIILRNCLGCRISSAASCASVTSIVGMVCDNDASVGLEQHVDRAGTR